MCWGSVFGVHFSTGRNAGKSAVIKTKTKSKRGYQNVQQFVLQSIVPTAEEWKRWAAIVFTHFPPTHPEESLL